MTFQVKGTRVGLSALTAAAAALGLAACGSSSSGGGTPSASSSATQSSAATSSAAATNAGATTTAASSSAAASSSSAGGGATAAPGTSLKLGKAATVPFTTTLKSGKNGPTYKLSVQVQSMDKGTLSDFNGIQLDAAEKASTPYYVKAKITNLGPAKIDTESNDPGIQIEGVDKTGETQQSVTFFGDFPKCDEKSAPNPMAAGSSFETCLTFLIPGGITKVAYTGTGSYIDKPVTWSP